MAYGLTPQGWNGKPMPVIVTELDTGLKGIVGESAGTEPDGTIPLRSLAGQIKTFLADGFGGMWDLLQELYSCFDPNKAKDTALDALGALTGTARNGATFSQVVATCTGTPTTVLPEGRVATVTTSASRFASTADATIAALTAWAGSTSYAVGARRTNASRAYVCITAGTSDGSGGPTTTSDDITDGTVHWKYLGQGTGAVDVNFMAEVSGPIGADAGQLASIATPVSGWNSVTNLLDAAVGQSREVDSRYRLRRAQELSARGNSVPNAIRANLLKINQGSTDPDHLPVTAAFVFYNPQDGVDGNGLPGHSVECLVQGAPDADVAQVVLDSVAAGTDYYGSTSVPVVDDGGITQTVKFTRPTDVPIWIIANVLYNPKLFPLVGGEQLIKDALVFYGDAFQIGQSVRSNPLEAAIFDGPTGEGATSVPGIIDVTSLLIGIADPPVSSALIPITPRQLATFDTSRITIVLTPGTP